jgi:hypothetical protein
LAPLLVEDGKFTQAAHDGGRCWLTPPRRYLYFDVDDAFHAPGGVVEIELEYLDTGSGRIVLEYDSTDARAPHQGAYTPHRRTLTRAGTTEWRTATFSIPNARFAGSQNAGADFRFYNSGADLRVRAVRVKRVEAGPSGEQPAAR